MRGDTFDVSGEPESSLTPIREVGFDERDALLDSFRARQPLVVRDYHRNDPAMQNWSFESLGARTPEDTTVDVDVGNAMVTAGGLSFERVDFHQYLADRLSQLT